MMKLVFLFCFLLGGGLLAQRKDYLLTIQTPYGDIKAILHDQTPLHKQNFLRLVSAHFYDSLLFHRVIPQFMVQGGDPTSKGAAAGLRLGAGGGQSEKIAAELRPELFHQRGALAAARDNNPEKKSSASQFYIVQGSVWNDSSLNAQSKRIAGARSPTPAQRGVYKTIGGSPHLDGNYTVFGQVLSGMAAVDSIAAQPRDANNRPLKNLKMTITAKKMRKKKISRLYNHRFE